MSKDTKYGLILNKGKSLSSCNNRPVLRDRHAVFEDDCELVDESTKIDKSGHSSSSNGVDAYHTSAFLKRQMQGDIETALEEDPTIFDYDAVYDNMKSEPRANFHRGKLGKDSNERKDARYIEGLLRAADQRKREKERRLEKAIQKERIKELDKFNDTESFVTNSYREKLKKMKEDEERERGNLIVEERCDVTKQADLSQFYRNLLCSTNCSSNDSCIENQDQKGISARKNKRMDVGESSLAVSRDNSVRNVSSVTQPRIESSHQPYHSSDEKPRIPCYLRHVCNEDEADYENDKGKRRSKGFDIQMNWKLFEEKGEKKGDDVSNKLDGKSHELVGKIKAHEGCDQNIRVREEFKTECHIYAENCNESREELVIPLRESISKSRRGKHDFRGKDTGLKCSKRNVGEALNEAKEKYLVRKKAKVSLLIYDDEDVSD